MCACGLHYDCKAICSKLIIVQMLLTIDIIGTMFELKA
jgi:hypothetical protein